MYLLFRAGGSEAQNEMWNHISEGRVRLLIPRENEWQRVQELMKRYSDVPLDLADASLFSLAEQTGDRQLFTIDRRLRAVQLRDGSYFRVVP
jgi:predicted nucleic acid-binding protein